MALTSLRELTTFLWTGFETADPGQFRRDELDRLQIYTVGDVSRLCVWFLRPRDAIKLLLLAQSDRSCKERLAEARRFVGIFNQEDRQAFGPCAEDILHRLQRLDVCAGLALEEDGVEEVLMEFPDWNEEQGHSIKSSDGLRATCANDKASCEKPMAETPAMDRSDSMQVVDLADLAAVRGEGTTEGTTQKEWTHSPDVVLLDVRCGRGTGPWRMADKGVLSQTLIKDMQQAYAGASTRHICFADGEGRFSCWHPKCMEDNLTPTTPARLASHWVRNKTNHSCWEDGKEVLFAYVQVNGNAPRVMTCRSIASVGQSTLRPFDQTPAPLSFQSDQQQLRVEAPAASACAANRPRSKPKRYVPVEQVSNKRAKCGGGTPASKISALTREVTGLRGQVAGLTGRLGKLEQKVDEHAKNFESNLDRLAGESAKVAENVNAFILHASKS